MVDVNSADSSGVIPLYSDRYDNLWVRNTLIVENGISNGSDTSDVNKKIVKLAMIPWADSVPKAEAANLENTAGYFIVSDTGTNTANLLDGFVDGQLTRVHTASTSGGLTTVNFRRDEDAAGVFGGAQDIAVNEEATFIWNAVGEYWTWIGLRDYT